VPVGSAGGRCRVGFAADVGVREAMAADAPGVAAVQVATWRSAYRDIVPAPYLAALSVERRAGVFAAMRRDPVTGHGLFVAVAPAGSEVVGFASCGPDREGPSPVAGELSAIYVLPAWQRQGVGRRLVAAVARRLVGAGRTSMRVWVLTANEPGRLFYERLGGRVLATRWIEVGGAPLEETAYGWSDLAPMCGEPAS
jgi:ribosomal protein S18 acetylase RimI-like enzyme